MELILDNTGSCPYLSGTYLFKINNEKSWMCEICSNLTKKTPERDQ